MSKMNSLIQKSNYESQKLMCNKVYQALDQCHLTEQDKHKLYEDFHERMNPNVEIKPCSVCGQVYIGNNEIIEIN